jgi:hypothetical protein
MFSHYFAVEGQRVEMKLQIAITVTVRNFNWEAEIADSPFISKPGVTVCVLALLVMWEMVHLAPKIHHALSYHRNDMK